MFLHSIAELLPVLSELRRQRKSIVLAPGCFDLLHAGHVALLREARLQGDFVIVTTNTDASISRAKGPDRPIVSLPDRVAMLASCRYVDAVIAYDEETPTELCRIIRPAVMVKGGQYSGESLPGAEYCGRVHLARMLESRSTSIIVQTARVS